MIKRFKSTCRSFSRRIVVIKIMQGPDERWKPSTGVWQRLWTTEKEAFMTQKNQQVESQAALSDKRIVVLGGSSGLGLAVAQQAVAQGAKAIIASSNGDRVKQAVATLGAKAEGHTLDLSNEPDIQNFFEKIGDFDHLVFTAGDTLQLDELAVT